MKKIKSSHVNKKDLWVDIAFKIDNVWHRWRRVANTAFKKRQEDLCYPDLLEGCAFLGYAPDVERVKVFVDWLNSLANFDIVYNFDMVRLNATARDAIENRVTRYIMIKGLKKFFKQNDLLYRDSISTFIKNCEKSAKKSNVFTKRNEKHIAKMCNRIWKRRTRRTLNNEEKN